MKKLCSLLFGLALLVGMGTSASAVIYTNTVDLNFDTHGSGKFSWRQPVTNDFQIPYDVLNSATLTINASYVNNINDRVYVQGIYEGLSTLLSGFFQGIHPSTSGTSLQPGLPDPL